MVLNPSATPGLMLMHEDPFEDKYPGRTLYLEIDLKVDPMGGQPVDSMTAVFAPDPKQLSGEVDVLLWLHGDKVVFASSKRKRQYDFSGQSIQEYLKIPECRLREFILQTSKKQFLLVAPTLGDRTGGKAKDMRWGLLDDQAEAEAYLQQVLNGVNKHMGKKVTGIRNLVLAGHSGGGHALGHMAESFSGKYFNKVNEVWCFDCTYWGADPFIAWAKRGHSNPRLWVYSTGGTVNGTTGPSAYAIWQEFWGKKPAPSKGSTPTTKPTTKVEVMIDHYAARGKPLSTDGFDATYHGSADGHYESLERYLPTLVDISKNLQ